MMVCQHIISLMTIGGGIYCDVIGHHVVNIIGLEVHVSIIKGGHRVNIITHHNIFIIGVIIARNPGVMVVGIGGGRQLYKIIIVSGGSGYHHIIICQRGVHYFIGIHCVITVMTRYCTYIIVHGNRGCRHVILVGCGNSLCRQAIIMEYIHIRSNCFCKRNGDIAMDCMGMHSHRTADLMVCDSVDLYFIINKGRHHTSSNIWRWRLQV
mmetsp:Transcript_24420/g.29517  ORF Transcript_24420/g.29517 Transcript_24420/m.29517 type:complete len:209 (-) Transcript_24420:282-908(-)